MIVRDVVEVLESIAPPDGAEAWDNVGLLVGAGDWSADRVLLTIDLTAPVLAEAIARDAGLVVAYHPLIFEPLPRVTDASPKAKVVLDAIRAGVAVYSPHTALDAAPGGVNDWLAAGVGPGRVRPLAPSAGAPATESHKVVTFCPAGSAGPIRDALARAGAGTIGAYRRCSFEIEGTGTFEGGAGTNPAVGRAGSLQRVGEVRLEMVCGTGALAATIAALRAAHPYEEPPIEIYRLEPRPRLDAGAGRCVELDRPARVPALAERLKQVLGVDRLDVAVPPGPARACRTVGICAGAGGSLLDAALAAGCDLFVTGELRHHAVLDAVARDCAVMLAGHTNTERGYLKRLRATLARRLPDVELKVSRKDADPLRAM